MEVELWRITKDTRELRCIVGYMPSGLDSAHCHPRSSNAVFHSVAFAFAASASR